MRIARKIHPPILDVWLAGLILPPLSLHAQSNPVKALIGGM